MINLTVIVVFTGAHDHAQCTLYNHAYLAGLQTVTYPQKLDPSKISHYTIYVTREREKGISNRTLHVL